MYGGSGCTIYSILQYQLVILKVVPAGSCIGYPPATQPHRIFNSVVNRIDIKYLLCNHIVAKGLFFYKKKTFFILIGFHAALFYFSILLSYPSVI